MRVYKTTHGLKAYTQQRVHAKKRGIEWLFTFEEWLKCWEDALGLDWSAHRGRGKGKYCMGRFGDVGPYASWNVEIILYEDNSSFGLEGRPVSKETRDKIRRSNTGKKASPETKAKLSAIGKGRPWSEKRRLAEIRRLAR
jgi:hypothetical protein